MVAYLEGYGRYLLIRGFWVRVPVGLHLCKIKCKK